MAAESSPLLAVPGMSGVLGVIAAEIQAALPGEARACSQSCSREHRGREERRVG
jgi:hypothetical protein